MSRIMTMDKNARNKEIQRNRTIQYFIEAARRIVDEEGIDALTIRKISDIAGYNSATMYNYFESLDHLKFYTALTYLNEYISAISKHIDANSDSLEVYKQVWKCYAHYAFEQNDLYYAILYSELEDDIEYYLDEFYEIYPFDKSQLPKSVQNILSDSLLFSKTKYLTNACIKDGYFNIKDGYMIDNLITAAFESFVVNIRKKKIKKEPYQEFCRIVDYLVDSKISK